MQIKYLTTIDRRNTIQLATKILMFKCCRICECLLFSSLVLLLLLFAGFFYFMFDTTFFYRLLLLLCKVNEPIWTSKSTSVFWAYFFRWWLCSEWEQESEKSKFGSFSCAISLFVLILLLLMGDNKIKEKERNRFCFYNLSITWFYYSNKSEKICLFFQSKSHFRYVFNRI